MAEPLFIRRSTGKEARRLRRQADAYDELLLRRLAERGEPPADFAADVDLPGDDELLIDTALYHAAAERAGTARALVRRERLALGGLAMATVGVVVAITSSGRR
jgi:hypothetical protein